MLVNNGVPPGVPTLRKSFRSLGKEIGVDEGTVRKRIKRFQEHHILRGWYLGVHPGATGNDVIHGWFEVGGESSKNDHIARLLTVPDVERVCNYLGPKVSIVLFGRKGTDHDATLRHLASVLGSGVTLHKQGVVITQYPDLKETDKAIIASLRHDPWKSFAAVSKEIGVSARTIKRRVTILSLGGVIYMLPIIDLKALQGTIPVELVVDYASSDARTSVNEKIASHIGEGLVFSDVSGPYGYFAFVLPNVAQVENVTRWAGQLHGVRKTHVDLLQDVILNRNHYESKRLAQVQIGEDEALSVGDVQRAAGASQ
jgi:DNA-binding Lrp family transcriptional regulator